MTSANSPAEPCTTGDPGYGSFARPWRGRPIRYDVSSHEGAAIPAAGAEWSARDVNAELKRRVDYHTRQHELVVDYYRVGYTFSLHLPIRRLPDHLPQGILGSVPYPWRTWLGWELGERWNTLAVAATALGGNQAETAGELLSRELGALAGWTSYDGDDGSASLVTGSLAGVLASILENSSEHRADVVVAARQAAIRLVDESLWPWFLEKFRERTPKGRGRLANIRCITLFQGAQLATAASHSRAAELQEQALDLYSGWLTHRREATPITEGPAYDGYLLDAMTRWLDGRLDTGDLRRRGSDVLLSLLPSWAPLSLPGRPDLLAPLGDVEGEMTHWTAVAIRVCQWFSGDGHRAWLLQLPLTRIPANALVSAAEVARRSSLDSAAVLDLVSGVRRQPSSVTLRTARGHDDLLVAVSAARGPVHHLHKDGGQVVVGWRGRFWVTDPGYQQYREGDEREYTVGVDAHNAPVIGGSAQDTQAARVLSPDDDEPSGNLHVELDLTECYGSVGNGVIHRNIWLIDGEPVVLVRDQLTDLPVGTEIRTSWLCGAGLAWAFVEGWARLSDGSNAMWIAHVDGHLDGDQVLVHPGSRGPVHLRQLTTTSADRETQWWAFVPDPRASWSPPVRRVEKAIKDIQQVQHQQR